MNLKLPEYSIFPNETGIMKNLFKVKNLYLRKVFESTFHYLQIKSGNICSETKFLKRTLCEHNDDYS